MRIVPSAFTSAERAAGPGSPLSPLGPGAPGAPGAPCGPVGTWPTLKSFFSSEKSLTFTEVTASFFNWAVPTLLLGITSETAATLVPASETSSAKQATTIAGDGRKRLIRVTELLLL